MSKKNCELCNKPARMFCESDQASLCFHCDEKVHAANFLVAKHSRTLLCHVCRSPTPWSAHGTGLGPTVSVCHGCSRRGVAAACTVDATSTSNSTTLHEEEDDDSHSGGDSDDFGYDDDNSEEEEEEEEEDENQVVPGTEEDATWQSGGGGPEMNENDSSLGAKRPHECKADGCCSSHHTETVSGFSSHEINSSIQESDECSHDSLASRPSKIRRRNEQVLFK